MRMVKESCGRCGTPLTDWIPNYYAIDVPFAQCPKCGTLNSRSAKATEWALMSSSRKTGIILLAFYWGLAYSVAAWIAVFWVAMKMDPSIGGQDTEAIWPVIMTIVTSLCIGLGGNMLRLLHEIRKSNARLGNREYRRQLKALNFLA